jgi:hypothetical protein
MTVVTSVVNLAKMKVGMMVLLMGEKKEIKLVLLAEMLVHFVIAQAPALKNSSYKKH